jgi:hypothetical protein
MRWYPRDDRYTPADYIKDRPARDEEFYDRFYFLVDLSSRKVPCKMKVVYWERDAFYTMEHDRIEYDWPVKNWMPIQTPYERVPETHRVDRMIFMGSGAHTIADEINLHGRLDEALSHLSGLQQGGCMDPIYGPEAQKKIDEIACDLFVALKGKPKPCS